MTDHITTAADAEQFVRNLVREAGEDLVIDGIKECFNCREAEIDDGRIWIADPQTGHWIDETNLCHYANWELAR